MYNSNESSNKNLFDEPIEQNSLNVNNNVNLNISSEQSNKLTYQISKSKSLPMLHNLDEEEEEGSINEEKKEKLALERRNSYLREKFYLKNNINKPQEEKFTKMIAMYDYKHQSEDELDLISNEEVTLIIPGKLEYYV